MERKFNIGDKVIVISIDVDSVSEQTDLPKKEIEYFLGKSGSIRTYEEVGQCNCGSCKYPNGGFIYDVDFGEVFCLFMFDESELETLA